MSTQQPVDVLAVMEQAAKAENLRLNFRERDELRDAASDVRDLITKAKAAASLIENAVAADILDGRYAQHATDLRAALARVCGAA